MNKLYAQANLYYNQELYKKSLDTFLFIIKKGVANDSIYYSISNIYFLFGNNTDSLIYINKCINIANKNNLTKFLEYKYNILVKLNNVKLFEDFLNDIPNITEFNQLIKYVKLNIPKYSCSMINTLLLMDEETQELKKKYLSIYFNSIYFNNLDNFYLNNGDIMDLNSYNFTDFKIKFRYFCFNYLYLIKQIKLNEVLLNLSNEAVLIEFRMLPHLEFLIRNSIYKLGSGWSQTIVCGNINYNFITDICSKISLNIKVIKIDYDNLTTTQYSKLLASIDFWNLFKGDKILIYQEDTCIFKTNINDFVNWDYIGAPWPHGSQASDEILTVGNGGFSLRSKQIMIDIINTITMENTKTTYSDLPEDVYFSKNIIDYKLGKLADMKSAYDFSLEVIINEFGQKIDPFGGHCFFVHYENWKTLMYEKIIYEYIITNKLIV